MQILSHKSLWGLWEQSVNHSEGGRGDLPPTAHNHRTYVLGEEIADVSYYTDTEFKFIKN